MNFSESPVRLCKAFHAPLSNYNGEQGVFFEVDDAKKKQRRNNSHRFDQTMKEYQSNSSDAFQELVAWLKSENIYFADVVPVSQKKFCEKSEEKRFSFIKNLKSRAAQQDAKKAMHKAVSACMRSTFAMANFWSKKVYISVEMKKYSLDSLKFVLLHEMCHINFPAIKGMAKEEVFCDAIAWTWISQLEPKISLHNLRLEVSQMLRPDTNHKDLLLLRSQIPNFCSPIL